MKLVFVILAVAALSVVVFGMWLLLVLRETMAGRITVLNAWRSDQRYVAEDPPWVSIRPVRESGYRRELAEFRTLMQRLDLISEFSRPDGYGSEETVERYRDRHTGQFWLLTDEEVGFNQFRQLAPERPESQPVDVKRVLERRSKKQNRKRNKTEKSRSHKS